ncbi:MAG: hypothetical protein NWF04_07920 [Candidatus Bathyarchaeota archaeon]|nr:hypothetical protein [Candidatus Bathyarchaeota archaeon]
MRTSVKLILVACLALSVGFAYASPMLITPPNVHPLPRVPEGPKAEFSVNIVYANFTPYDYLHNTTEYPNANAYGDLGDPVNVTYTSKNVDYNVVLNVTNLSDKPATLYDIAFTAAKEISVHQSILGGEIYGTVEIPDNGWFRTRLFGGIVDGVYLDGNWVNVTWIPEGRHWSNGSWQPMPYPDCLMALTQTYWRTSWDGEEYETIMQGPLTPDEARAFSADHTLNSTVPSLPENASETGVWFEGVPLAEYYDRQGNHLITMMYINGSWVDVTGKVTVETMQPFMIASGMLQNLVYTVGLPPNELYYADYYSETGTRAPLSTLPKWGNWGNGRCYSWLPFGWESNLGGFSNVWAPHESKLIQFNGTGMHFYTLGDDLACLDDFAGLNTLIQTGKLTLYASASHYVDEWLVNGTYYNTAATATQTIELQFENTANGYIYNGILADDQTFQPSNSRIEVVVAPRTQP